jgi:hypothetical protein
VLLAVVLCRRAYWSGKGPGDWLVPGPVSGQKPQEL